DNFRLNELDLFSQKRLAGGNFVRLGITIVGWPTLDDIGDVNVLPFHAHAFGNDVGQKLARATDEGLALNIFVASRAFTDEHQLRLGITDTENYMGSAGAEPAKTAVANRVAQLFESLRPHRRRTTGKEIFGHAGEQIGLRGGRH